MKRILQLLSLLTAIFIAGISGSYAFELNGFADVSFIKSTEGADEFRNGNFAFGVLDLYVAQTLDDIEILSELIIEEGNELDLERLTIGYTFSDALRLRAGRFHTPLGFWNTSYHHGVQIQPTIERPEFLRFDDDGGILTTHFVGAYLSGRVKTAAGAVEYGAMIGNGPKVTAPGEVEEGSANALQPNNTSDNSIGKAVAFNVAVSPAAVAGLKIGISAHKAEIKSDGTVIDTDNADSDNDLTTGADSVNVDQTILGTAFMYSTGNLSLSGEYFTIINSDEVTSKDYDVNAYYGLITYSLMDKWIPYVMYETLSVEEADPYVVSLGSVDTEKLTAGLRYNISYSSSIKGEYRDIIDKDGKDWNEFAVQWALAF